MKIKMPQGLLRGNFTLYNNEMHALVDQSSTHSYICIQQLSDKLPLIEPLVYDMHVTSPLGIILESTECIRTIP